MRGNKFTVLSVLAGALATGSVAQAASLGLQVLIDGEQVGSYDSTALGCQGDAASPTATCSGTNAQMGGAYGMELDSWNISVDNDPLINGAVAVTNLSSSTQQFTLIFTLPIVPIPGSSVIGGSVQGGATDLSLPGNGVTLSVGATSAFYTAMIDGLDVQSLYAGPQSLTSPGANTSLNVPNADFGTPIPSQLGPAALTSIGIRLDFLLSGNDSASFTSVFVVQPTSTVIPVPAAVWLFGSAIGVLGWLRRRTKH